MSNLLLYAALAIAKHSRGVVAPQTACSTYLRRITTLPDQRPGTSLRRAVYSASFDYVFKAIGPALHQTGTKEDHKTKTGTFCLLSAKMIQEFESRQTEDTMQLARTGRKKILGESRRARIKTPELGIIDIIHQY